MKEKFIENGIEYVRNDDYYIPNLKAPEGTYNIGKYGRLHSIFIKENRPTFSDIESKLSKELNGENLELFNELVNVSDEISATSSVENFKIGFRLGVLMMCDSLLFDDNIILKDIKL